MVGVYCIEMSLCFCLFLFFFFFSSRRRHTRLQGDWSSDVCSSDLVLQLEDLTADIDHDLLAEVTGCHCGRDTSDVAHLIGEVRRHEVHRVGEVLPRSEERRVGKECRSRGWTDRLRRRWERQQARGE